MNSYSMDWDNGEVWMSHTQQVVMEEERPEERPEDFDARMQALFSSCGMEVNPVVRRREA